jgi:phage shock protein A
MNPFSLIRSIIKYDNTKHSLAEEVLMGILSRFRAIMASNWNAMVDKAEDSEKTIDDFMRGLSIDLGKVRAETAAVQAEERRAKRVLDECRADIRKLQNYAERSLETGNEEDAAKFLDRKAPLMEKEAGLAAAYETAATNAARLKQMQDKMAADISQLEARRIQLKERMAATKEQQRMNSTGSSLGRSQASFKEMEEKANDAYYEAMAIAELRAGEKDDLDELFAEFDRNTAAAQAKAGLDAMKENLNKKE